MTPRLRILLAILTGIGALMLFDRPATQEPARGEGEQGLPHRASYAAPPLARADAPAPPADADAPVPDLFAGVAGTPAAPATAGQAGAHDPDAQPDMPFTLLGFKLQAGLREAYLLRHRDLLTVRPGAVVEQRYRVLALDEDAVRIKDVVSGSSFRVGFEDHQ